MIPAEDGNFIVTAPCCYRWLVARSTLQLSPVVTHETLSTTRCNPRNDHASAPTGSHGAMSGSYCGQTHSGPSTLDLRVTQRL